MIDAALATELAGLRPDLHRYCARLVGSAIDGEDVVQDAIAKALAALPTDAPTALRPWLFRVAHNVAIDHLRRYERRHVDGGVELDALDVELAVARDPAVVRASLARFLAVPTRQRAAIILKDVLGLALDEIAATLAMTVPAVKAALVRGRAALADAADLPVAVDAAERAQLERYAALFNARDWDGLRALLSEQCQLDLVAKATRRGPAVREYYGRYAGEQVRVEVGVVDGRAVLLAFEGDGAAPAYYIALGWRDGQVETIRDWRYARYVAEPIAL